MNLLERDSYGIHDRTERRIVFYIQSNSFSLPYAYLLKGQAIMGNKTVEGQGRLTKAETTFEGEKWRIFSGFPLNSEGDIVCPRCDAGIREIKDEFTVIQHSYLNDMDKYRYFCQCRLCNLRWVWSDEAKK